MIKDTLAKMLLEELDKEQKKQVDKWTTPNAASFSDKQFGGQDNHRISIPLVTESSAPVPPNDVKHHLERNGFEIHDYKNGLAKDKYGRAVKIGRVLAHPKYGNPDALKSFNDDLSLMGKKEDALKDYRVIISRHPYDVAGMSTNRGWTSCMDMDGGENSSYLKNDLKHGTHVAYMVHKDDTDIKNPIARIALKPYFPLTEKTEENLFTSIGSKSINNQLKNSDYFSGNVLTKQLSKARKDTPPILRPEESVYGTGGSAFQHTVRKWAEDNFKMNSSYYAKQPSLYHDDGKKILFENHAGKFEKYLHSISSRDYSDIATRIVRATDDKPLINKIFKENFSPDNSDHHDPDLIREILKKGDSHIHEQVLSHVTPQTLRGGYAHETYLPIIGSTTKNPEHFSKVKNLINAFGNERQNFKTLDISLTNNNSFNTISSLLKNPNKQVSNQVSELADEHLGEFNKLSAGKKNNSMWQLSQLKEDVIQKAKNKNIISDAIDRNKYLSTYDFQDAMRSPYFSDNDTYFAHSLLRAANRNGMYDKLESMAKSANDYDFSKLPNTIKIKQHITDVMKKHSIMRQVLPEIGKKEKVDAIHEKHLQSLFSLAEKHENHDMIHRISETAHDYVSESILKNPDKKKLQFIRKFHEKHPDFFDDGGYSRHLNELYKQHGLEEVRGNK